MSPETAICETAETGDFNAARKECLMKNIEDLLQKMPQYYADREGEEISLTEEEIQRIHQKTMQKIQGETKAESKIVKHPSFWRKYYKPLAAAAAACVVCMVGATAFAAFGLDDSIKNFFQINDNKSQQTAEKLTTNVESSAESNGIKLDLTQTIGDQSGFYAVIDASGVKDVPYTLTFRNTDLSITGKDGANYDYTADDIDSSAVDNGITKFPLLVSGVNREGADVNINGSHIVLSLQNIGYRNEHNKFVTLQEGDWKLSWDYQTNAEPERITVDKKISLMDSQGLWTDLTISPLSLTAHFKITKQGKTYFTEKEWNKYEKSDRLVVQFTDGSRIDSRYEDILTESWGSEKKEGYKRIGFHQIVDTKAIASVTFGGRTITLHESEANDKRIRLSSNAAKCYVELPESVASIFTLNEQNDAKNIDFGCSESTVTFVGRRGGARMPLFTIHRLKGSFSRSEMEDLNPMMTYIDFHNGYTYTIDYGECQTEAQLREFSDIMNRYITNILPFFEYMD